MYRNLYFNTCFNNDKTVVKGYFFDAPSKNNPSVSDLVYVEHDLAGKFLNTYDFDGSTFEKFTSDLSLDIQYALLASIQQRLLLNMLQKEGFGGGQNLKTFDGVIVRLMAYNMQQLQTMF